MQPVEGWGNLSESREIDHEGIEQFRGIFRELLREVDAAVAKDPELTYFAAYGTALGAVRDGDVIPWDGDADILVPAESFDALCTALRLNLPSPYYVCDPETFSDYEYLFPRVAIKGIHHNLAHVDLFPLLPSPVSGLSRRAYLLAAHALAQAFFIKRVDLRNREFYGPVKRWTVRVGKVLLTPVKDTAMIKANARLEAWFSKRDTGYLISPHCHEDYLHNFFESSWFTSTTAGSLRDVTVRVPVGVHEYLERVYDDYMQPLSPAEQHQELAFVTKYQVAPLRAQGVIS